MKIDHEFLNKRPLSASSLKAFRKSPKHYIQYLTEPYKTTPALIFGSLVDCLVLTPELYEKRFILMPKIDRRTKLGKIDYENFLKKAENKTVITEEQLENAKKCKESLYSVQMSRELLESVKKIQIKLKWKSKGLPMIGYADFESNTWGETFIVDLKTTADADPDNFIRSAIKFDYIIQCGAYLDAYIKKFYQFPYFIFLAVENSEPFNVSVNFCDNKFTELAKDELYGTLQVFKKCMDLNAWKQGYEFRIIDGLNYFTMQLPNYYKPKYIGL